MRGAARVQLGYTHTHPQHAKRRERRPAGASRASKTPLPGSAWLGRRAGPGREGGREGGKPAGPGSWRGCGWMCQRGVEGGRGGGGRKTDCVHVRACVCVCLCVCVCVCRRVGKPGRG